MEKARLFDYPPFVVEWLGYASPAGGEHDKAEAMIAPLNQMSDRADSVSIHAMLASILFGV
jgi:hypothetical protein